MDRKMEPEICSSIIEFVLRKSRNEMLAKTLIQAFPSLSPNFRLKKTLLLRSIMNEIMGGSVSEKILDHLELIHGIDCNLNLTILDSMKQAYSAVALECTAKYLTGTWNGSDNYLSAMNRIWEVRIQNLEKSKSELVSEQLRSHRLQLEAAAGDDEVANALIRANARNNAILTLKLYLREALDVMGPTVLEREFGSASGDSPEESISLAS
ncbi:hypothetical protein PTKIN_Ptkin06aG0129500 [Pterospermum kingtungense]